MVGGGGRKDHLVTELLTVVVCNRNQGKVEGIHQASVLPEHCERSLIARKGKEQTDAAEQRKGRAGTVLGLAINMAPHLNLPCSV